MMRDAGRGGRGRKEGKGEDEGSGGRAGGWKGGGGRRAGWIQYFPVTERRRGVEGGSYWVRTPCEGREERKTSAGEVNRW